MEMDNGGIELSYAPFDVRNCVDKILCVSTFKAQDRPEVEIINLFNGTSFPDDVLILGDEFRISIILLNLLSNAAKFTTKGKICIRTEFLEEVQPDHPEYIQPSNGGNCDVKIQFVVEDTGIGMPQEFLSKIGTLFAHIKNTQLNSSGMGIGLVIVKAIIAKMNGTFKVESTLGVGSRFTVTVHMEGLKTTNKCNRLQLPMR